MISPGICYAIVFIGIGWHSANDELTFCFMPESWGPGAKNDWVGSTVMFNALVVGTYTYLVVIVRRRRKKGEFEVTLGRLVNADSAAVIG
jgi:hypothetical protein